MGDIQSGWIIEGFGWMKETETRRIWVTKWAIIEEKSFYALNIEVGGHWWSSLIINLCNII